MTTDEMNATSEMTDDAINNMDGEIGEVAKVEVGINDRSAAKTWLRPR